MAVKSRKKVFIIAIITLTVLTLLVFSSIPGSPLYELSTPFSFIADPVQGFITSAFEKAERFVISVREADRIQQENQELKDEITGLEKRVKELEENGRRWEELKEAFAIKEIFSGYELIGACVLTRELGDWFDVFRVGAGKREGIAADGSISYAVVDEIGRAHV